MFDASLDWAFVVYLIYIYSPTIRVPSDKDVPLILVRRGMSLALVSSDINQVTT